MQGVALRLNAGRGVEHVAVEYEVGFDGAYLRGYYRPTVQARHEGGHLAVALDIGVELDQE